MKILKGQLSILLIIYLRGSSCTPQAVCDTGKEIWKLYLMIDNMTSTTNYSASQLYKSQIDEIHKQLQKLENSIDFKTFALVAESWSFSVTLHKSLDTLEIFIQEVDQFYDNFTQQIREMRYNDDDLRLFMRSVIPEIEEKIITIRRTVLEPIELLEQTLVSAIANYVTSEQPYLCDGHRIISEVLVQLFKMIVIAEMKAHVMSATVNSYQYRHADLRWVNDLSREILKVQIERYVSLFSRSVTITDAVYLRACEPDSNRWIRDKSFYELEGTVQTAIFGYNWEKCDVDNCHDILFKKSGQCEAKYYDDRSGCSGDLTECVNLESMQACVLKSGLHKFHNVISSKRGLLGIFSECPSSNTYIIENGNGTNLSYNTCACNCYGDDNKISLSIMESNVKSNMVITGLRFIRQNQILYIQPREGKLYANGRIRRYSERWIPIPKNISASQVHPINRENRIFFFDNLRLPSNNVLTGIKFNRVERKSVTGFAIEIFGVSFNFKTGKLDSNFLKSKRASNNDPGEPLLFEPINPADVTSPLKLSPANKKYVQLERSNLRHDFGQSTLPLFDAVPVTTYQPLPLGGVGIFHKGADDSAGFISLKVYGIIYAQFFTDVQAICMENNKLSFDQTQ